jgi:hypothetical protein
MNKNSAVSPGWRTMTLKSENQVGPAWWCAASVAAFAFVIAITWLLT